MDILKDFIETLISYNNGYCIVVPWLSTMIVQLSLTLLILVITFTSAYIISYVRLTSRIFTHKLSYSLFNLIFMLKYVYKKFVLLNSRLIIMLTFSTNIHTFSNL